MKKSKEETAEILARQHFAVEPHLKKIYLLKPIKEADPGEPIKLLEVVEGTIERGIEPVAFAPDRAHGIQYPSVIVEISPSEYESIRKKKLGFGSHKWTIGRPLPAN